MRPYPKKENVSSEGLASNNDGERNEMSLSSLLLSTNSIAAPTFYKLSNRLYYFNVISSTSSFHHPNRFSLPVMNRRELSSEGDRLVDGMDFGELCNEFECISSPAVEATARQLVRDILELRQGNRALATFALSVSYKDPVRSFTGRDKYKRPLWITDALHNPTTSVQEMVMLSTSVLNIKWTIKGKPKYFILGGDLIIKVKSKFTLNQISGQVVEHEELWDLSGSSIIAQASFWASQRLFATVEAGKDVADFVKDLSSKSTTDNNNMDVFPDPYGDPAKFFQRDDSFQRDLYQIALLLAVIYFVVQYLRTTL